MAKKIYVGNISYETTASELEQLFGAYGEIASVNVVTDRETGRSRGFAFVEMTTDEAARAAIAALNGQMSSGRQLRVSEARPRKPRMGGGGGNRRW